MRELYDIISEKMAYDEIKWNEFGLSLKSSLRKQFFELFEKGYSDRDIAHKLFKSEIAVTSHRNTKHEIKSALQFELLKFKASNYHYTAPQQAQYKIIKQLTIFKTLIYLGANKSVLDLGENILKLAMSYGLTDIIVDVSIRMCYYYSRKEVSCVKVEYYMAIHNKYNSILQNENNAELAYHHIIAYSSGNSSDHNMAIQLAKKFLSSNKIPSKKIKSHRFYLFYYMIMLNHDELQNNYQAVEQIAQDAYEHFCSLQFEHKVAKEVFIHKLIYSRFQLNKADSSFEYLEKAIQLARKGHTNWFITLEFKIRALLSSVRYNEAQETYQSMITHRNFDHQPLHHRIRWKLIGSYVQFLRQIELISGEQPTTQFVNKHYKFLNKHRNELGEMKVPYIISQLLNGIYKRDYDEMEARIYALKSFCGTYLKKSTPNYRSSCFIKMLLLVPQCNFNSKLVERRASLYAKRLREESFKIDPSRIVEVIPYEKLWSIILTHLSTPKRARTSEYTFKDWDMGKKES